jgi:hypothetical protein
MAQRQVRRNKLGAAVIRKGLAAEHKLAGKRQ